MRTITLKIKTPNQSTNGNFQIGRKLVKPVSLTHWLEKAIRRASLASAKDIKSPQIIIQVYYGTSSKFSEPMTNSSLASSDFDYLFNTALAFLEDYVSQETFNKTNQYKWL